MFDVLAILSFIIVIWGIVLMFMYIFGESTRWYLGFPALVAGLILYFIITNNTSSEDYLIDKNSVQMETMELPKHKYELIFSDTLRVEVTEYDLPLSGLWDYEIYRIYLDSTSYIEVRTSMYDSLDIQVGNKLFKE